MSAGWSSARDVGAFASKTSAEPDLEPASSSFQARPATVLPRRRSSRTRRPTRRRRLSAWQSRRTWRRRRPFGKRRPRPVRHYHVGRPRPRWYCRRWPRRSRTRRPQRRRRPSAWPARRMWRRRRSCGRRGPSPSRRPKRRPRRCCLRSPRICRRGRSTRRRRPSAWPLQRMWRRRRSCGRRSFGDVVILVGPNHDGAAVDRHRAAEVVIRRGVAGSWLGHLAE